MTRGQREGEWPVPKFSVDIEGVAADVVFQEVSGLDVETQPIEYRAGRSPTFSTVKMPGISKYGSVTMKRGIFAKDNKFFDWYAKIRASSATRATVTIRLLDESGNPTMVWTLANAWPSKITATDFEAEGNEVAVETLELAHEGLTIANS
jgi:phage tail-like protein